MGEGGGDVVDVDTSLGPTPGATKNPCKNHAKCKQLSVKSVKHLMTKHLPHPRRKMLSCNRRALECGQVSDYVCLGGRERGKENRCRL